MSQKYIPYTAHVKWHDRSQGEVEFETEKGLKRWLADLDVSHTMQVVIQFHPMQIGVTYEVPVHYQGGE